MVVSDCGSASVPSSARRDAQRRSHSFASGGLPRHQKGARKSSRAAELEGSEVLPLSQFEQVVLGNPALLRALPQVGPFLSWEPLPLDLRYFFNAPGLGLDRKSTRLNSSHLGI